MHGKCCGHRQMEEAAGCAAAGRRIPAGKDCAFVCLLQFICGRRASRLHCAPRLKTPLTNLHPVENIKRYPGAAALQNKMKKTTNCCSGIKQFLVVCHRYWKHFFFSLLECIKRLGEEYATSQKLEDSDTHNGLCSQSTSRDYFTDIVLLWSVAGFV